MRNLKKVLSLALCLVMLLGMMVVGAGATSFTDDASIKNKEAVEVLSGIEAFVGDDKGNFNPAGTMTRAQAAVIIAKLDLGEAFGNLATTGAAAFEDVAEDHWAKAYIDYCVGRGLIQGDGKGHFFPDQDVTGVQFALMTCYVLGYDAANEQISGDTWAVKAAALARKAGLTKGVVLSATAPMTRDDMAQVAFNALKADMVEYDGKSITIGDVTIPAGKATVVESDNTVKYDNKADKKVQLCEEKFPELKLDSTGSKTDAFGRPVDEWKYGKTVIATSSNVTSTAVVTYTNKVSATQVGKDLKNYDYTTLKKNSVITDGAAEADADTQSATITDATTLASQTDPGKLVEVYATSDGDITKVVIVNYTVDTLKSITEKNGKTTYSFETKSSKANDEDNTNVILEGAIEEGDVVTIATVDSKYYVYPTTNFTANQTAKKTSAEGVTTITVGGEQYVVATGITGVSASAFSTSKDEATYYVDQNGYMVKVKGVEAPATQYAMIVKAAGTVTGGDLDNPTGYSVTVRAVMADGTIADHELALTTAVNTDNIWDPTDYTSKAGTVGDLLSGTVRVCANGDKGDINTKANDNLADSNGATAGNGDGKVYGYHFDSDGKMVLEPAVKSNTLTQNKMNQVGLASYTGTTSKAGASSQSGTTVLFNNNTKFVLYNEDANHKWTAEAPVSGIADLKLPGGGLGGVALVKVSSSGSTTAGAASIVFLKGATAAAQVDYVYVDASEYTEELRDDKTVYALKGVAADGTDVDVWVAATSDLTGDGLYPYSEDGKLGAKVTLKVEGVDTNTAPAAGAIWQMTVDTVGSLIKAGDGSGAAYVNIPDDVKPVFIASGVESLENGQTALVVMDKADTVKAIFVTAKAPVSAAITNAGSVTVTIAGAATSETGGKNVPTATVAHSESGDTTASGTGTLIVTLKKAGNTLANDTSKVEFTPTLPTGATIAVDTAQTGAALADGKITLTRTSGSWPSGFKVKVTNGESAVTYTVSVTEASDDSTGTITFKSATGGQVTGATGTMSGASGGAGSVTLTLTGTPNNTDTVTVTVEAAAGASIDGVAKPSTGNYKKDVTITKSASGWDTATVKIIAADGSYTEWSITA